MMAANQRSDNDEAVGGEGDQALRRMEELARETAVGDTMYEKRWVFDGQKLGGLGQTVETPKESSGKLFPREVGGH